MSQRFYSEQSIGGDRATLAGGEAHHLIHVMRAAPGDSVVLFDGSGCEFDASVARIGRREVEFDIVARREVDREAHTHLTLAVPLPKGDRSRWLVEKAVELGVAKMIPLITARSTSGKEKGADKLDRFVIEASKQCGRNRLMEIAAPLRFDELLRIIPSEAQRWIAQPQSDAACASHTTDSSSATYLSIAAAIGPEGGFSEVETQSAIAAGWRPIYLGPRTLRVETAAIALAARLVG